MLRLEMTEGLISERFRSGDALLAFGSDRKVVLWNAEAERLTGTAATDAIGRYCWDVLRGVDEGGALVCHAGCSAARLALEGWPMPCRRLRITTRDGRKSVTVSMIALRTPGENPLTIELLRNGGTLSEKAQTVTLTRRQRQVLGLLVEGLPAKVIARKLCITEVTVRNHIQAVLRALRCHSQLEAVAEARRRGLVQE